MNKPHCQTVIPWLKVNLGKKCLAPLTSTDTKALMAAVQIVELYAYDCHRDVLQAFGDVVLRMQPHCRELAYHAIAHVRDWPDRAEMWAAADLPGIDRPRVCAFEPGAVRREEVAA